MTSFFTFLATHQNAILILLLMLVVSVALLRWILWMFGWGRFKPEGQPADSAAALEVKSSNNITYILADLFVKVINDFRHLLALIIVLMFALALGYVLWRGGGNMENLKEGLQAVMSTLGGIIGSIIGYYFGESAAKSVRPSPPTVTSGDEPEQNDDDGAAAGGGAVRQAPAPPV